MATADEAALVILPTWAFDGATHVPTALWATPNHLHVAILDGAIQLAIALVAALVIDHAATLDGAVHVAMAAVAAELNIHTAVLDGAVQVAMADMAAANCSNIHPELFPPSVLKLAYHVLAGVAVDLDMDICGRVIAPPPVFVSV